jgi:hypothetical protein
MTAHKACYVSHPVSGKPEDRMKKAKLPPTSLREWIEFCWLVVTNPVFRAAPDKRKAYFEYRLGRIYSVPCF